MSNSWKVFLNDQGRWETTPWTQEERTRWVTYFNDINRSNHEVAPISDTPDMHVFLDERSLVASCRNDDLDYVKTLGGSVEDWRVCEDFERKIANLRVSLCDKNYALSLPKDQQESYMDAIGRQAQDEVFGEIKEFIREAGMNDSHIHMRMSELYVPVGPILMFLMLHGYKFRRYYEGPDEVLDYNDIVN